MAKLPSITFHDNTFRSLVSSTPKKNLLITTVVIPSSVVTNGSSTSFTPVIASNGNGILSFALTGGILPTGLSFNTSNGLISGISTTILAQTIFTVTVTDQTTPSLQVSSKTFILTAIAISVLITTVALPTNVVTVGSSKSFIPVIASGGIGILSYALSGGTLPTGLSFNTLTGLISGTPATVLAQTTFTVTATDQTTPTPQTSSKTFTLIANAALATVQAIPSITLTDGSSTSFKPVTASNGTGAYNFALSGGVLPTGLSFNTLTGLISGTPATVLAQTTFTVTVTDQTTPTPQASSKTFTLTANALFTTTLVIPSKVLTDGSPASFIPVTASNGTGTYSFALSGGTLPTGLSFNTLTGLISGTPSTVLAQTTFTVTVTDQTTPTPQTSSKTFTLTANAALATVQAIPNTTLTDGVVASFTPVTASGGTGTRTFALAGGTLPVGLIFSTSTGLISGTPSTVLAQTTFTVTVTDQTTPTPQSSSKTFILIANAASSSASSILHYASGSAGIPAAVSIGFNLADISFAGSLNSLPTGVKGLIWLGDAVPIPGANTSLINAATPAIGNPNLFGFYLWDEPDPTGQFGQLVTPAQLKAESDWIHANVPGAKTFIVLMNMGSDSVPSYTNTYNPANTGIDLYGIDFYPVWTVGSLPFTLINTYVDAAVASGIPLSKIVPIYQTFGGGTWVTDTGAGIVVPTDVQMQQMLDIWKAKVPNPVFDYAYAWGSQQGDTALESLPTLQSIFATHNAITVSSPFAVNNSILTISSFKTPATLVTPIQTEMTQQGTAGSVPTWCGGMLISNVLTRKFQYGYFEFLVQLPIQGKGMFPAIWMFASDVASNTSLNKGQAEIDILEIEGAPNVWNTTLHMLNNSAVGTTHLLGTRSEDVSGWHTYGFDWQPTYLKFYRDNVLIYTVTGAEATWYNGVYMDLRMNFAMNAPWFGSTLLSDNTTPSPMTMSIDYVRVWDLKP